ncbi:hemerythrin domain-containing protein [Nocardioides sp. zg-1228]|uniref:hemerythrin domain-containing protein n=1 Tax=Nocardioides sp. zg-1228 TaxID=2763008 RepID=UPI0016431057|nr:hemerythrin domain-containing protein [Nocardioides sp. zg-1228]MBC2932362.1 hemerythrin domain-containing protein [Nocardioides sp. zg-1228]QSF57876.1 hemerythrin domain-containing protein [Nocardioides sp. zg-1228]
MPPIDDESRPRVAGSVELTPQQRAGGDHLRMVHDHFRAQLAALSRAVEGVRDGAGDGAGQIGAGDLAAVRAGVHGLAPALTAQQVAGMCGQVCRFLTMHHSIEDQSLFPAVATLERYRPVAVRLGEEHLVVHAHLERVDDLAVAVASDPARVEELLAAVTDLRTDLESHFAYEEAEMAEPLGLLGLLV